MRCPVCRAENAEKEPTCRRCRADLSLLVSLDQQRDHHLAAAQRALSAGDTAQAIDQATLAERLRKGRDANQLRALGHLLENDFAAALSAWSQSQEPRTE